MISRKRQDEVIAAIEAADPSTPKARLYDELFPADTRTPTRGEFEELWHEARRRQNARETTAAKPVAKKKA